VSWRCPILVLSRRVGEKFLIGDNITVVVNKIAGNRVTFGIDAPGDVKIIRSELKPHAVPPTKPLPGSKP
jgi:carbon storage regulator